MKARENPFRVERVRQLRFRPEAVGESWTGLLDRLRAMHYRAAIVGPEGSGKTTLLEDLGAHFAEAGFAVRFCRLNRDGPRQIPHGVLDALDPHTLILIDGAEQLAWLRWKSLERRSADAAGLIATLHKQGRLPTLLQTSTTPGLLADLVRTLLPESADAPLCDLGKLYRNQKGNLRDCLRALYDIHAATGVRETVSEV